MPGDLRQKSVYYRDLETLIELSFPAFDGVVLCTRDNYKYPEYIDKFLLLTIGKYLTV